MNRCKVRKTSRWKDGKIDMKVIVQIDRQMDV